MKLLRILSRQVSLDLRKTLLMKALIMLLKKYFFKVYDVNSIAEIFINIRNDDNVIDQFFLEKIEKEYTHFKNINTQIISSQSFNRHYHYRYFWLISYLSTTIKLVDHVIKMHSKY